MLAVAAEALAKTNAMVRAQETLAGPGQSTQALNRIFAVNALAQGHIAESAEQLGAAWKVRWEHSRGGRGSMLGAQRDHEEECVLGAQWGRECVLGAQRRQVCCRRRRSQLY